MAESGSAAAAILDQSQPRVSQHLKQLCEAGLLERFRDGKRVFYRVPRVQHADSTLKRLLELVPDDDPVFAADWNLLLELGSHAGIFCIVPAVMGPRRHFIEKDRVVVVDEKRPLGSIRGLSR